MKINSTTICYALIVLIVGYLIYINRNVIMGMTSKFGQTVDKMVYVYNYIPKQNITVTSGEDKNYTSGRVTDISPVNLKIDAKYNYPATIYTPYGLNIMTNHPTPTRSEPRKTQLRYFRINFAFENMDYVFFGYYDNQYKYMVMRRGKLVQPWTVINNL